MEEDIKKIINTGIQEIKEQQRILNKKIDEFNAMAKEAEEAEEASGLPISQLSSVTNLSNEAVFPLVQDSTTSKVLFSEMKENIKSSITPIAMRKVIEITELKAGGVFDVDLSTYTQYVRFHFSFPTTRSNAELTINITGISELLFPIESIVMSGLDNDGETYLASSKRGTITFTLDSADYEFPSSIYHFGGFATGGNPAYIFLHIDYVEANSSSSFKYIADNAIYADENQTECELWSMASEVDDFIFFKENSTLFLQQAGGVQVIDTNAIEPIFIFTETMIENPAYFVASGHLAFSNKVPIIKSTGLLSYNNNCSIISYRNELTRMYRNTLKTTSLINMTNSRGKLESSVSWDPLPTDFGLYRIIVKGTYAQKQLSI